MSKEEPPTKKSKKSSILDVLSESRRNSSVKFNEKRVKRMNESVNKTPSNVYYWMNRDQRVQDNWAFIYAQKVAKENEGKLNVFFHLKKKWVGYSLRHYDFMLKGLLQVQQECHQLKIPFNLVTDDQHHSVAEYCKAEKCDFLVTDFSPLREYRKETEEVAKKLKDVPLAMVDAHNIVPLWVTSEKQEYGARTIRRKIHDNLKEFMTEFLPVTKHTFNQETKLKAFDVDDLCQNYFKGNKKIKPVDEKYFIPGTRAGYENMDDFCHTRIKDYANGRNDPNKKVLSKISPWLHFGQISAQRTAIFVKENGKKYKDSVDAFIEESVVRRELSDNFCYYQKNYDNLDGAFDWAKTSLNLHRGDKREYVYTREEFESAKTHDDLWNAAQIQLMTEGKLQGFMRMYWAKKILEWTESPEVALETAIYFNDAYALDGSDPNGYVGCMWSIVGIHDQGWAERAVFGKIRYMNYAGCKRKFDVARFVQSYGAKSHFKDNKNSIKSMMSKKK